MSTLGRPTALRTVAQRLAMPFIAMQTIWLALLVLTALVWLQFKPSPFAAGLRHWPIPAQLLGAGPPPAAGDLPTPAAWALILLGALLLGAAGALWWALLRASVLTHVPDRVLWLIVGGAALMGLTLVIIPALPSDDVISYILYGRISAIHHANPLVALPSQFSNDPFLAAVYWQNTRSVYGPGWLIASNILTVIAQFFGGSPALYVALYKFLALGAHLVSVVLIWDILSRTAPERRLLGTLLYAWNPLALWEFAASAHNDALMLALFLGGGWCLVRGREISALIFWGASIATKYVLILLVPLWLWGVLLAIVPLVGETTRHLWFRRVQAGAWRVGVIAATCVALTLPFWHGPTTFLSLLDSPTAQQLGNSPMDMISWPLRAVVGGLTHLSPNSTRLVVVTTLKVAGALGFLTVWFWQLTRRAPRDLYAAWGWALLAFLVLASGWFWPWYATWPLIIMALRPWDRLTTASLLLSNGVLILYSFLPLVASPLYGVRSVLAFGPALGYLAWRWWQDRAAHHATTRTLLEAAQ
jgi:hypothetical protein